MTSVGRLDRADDDVVGPEPLDLPLGILADALADGQQQITLATPKKMPSTVSSDRSGCSSRLFMPSWKVRRKNILGMPSHEVRTQDDVRPE